MRIVQAIDGKIIGDGLKGDACFLGSNKPVPVEGEGHGGVYGAYGFPGSACPEGGGLDEIIVKGEF